MQPLDRVSYVSLSVVRVIIRCNTHTKIISHGAKKKIFDISFPMESTLKKVETSDFTYPSKERLKPYPKIKNGIVIAAQARIRVFRKSPPFIAASVD